MDKIQIVLDQCEKEEDDPNDFNGVNYKILYDKFVADIGVPLPTVSKSKTFSKPTVKGHTAINIVLKQAGAASLSGYSIEEYFTKRAKNDYTYTAHFGIPELPYRPEHLADNKEAVASHIQKHLLKFAISSKSEYDKDQLNQDAEDVFYFQLKLNEIIQKASKETIE